MTTRVGSVLGFGLGSWVLVFGLGFWSLVLGFGLGFWSLVFGLWSLVLGFRVLPGCDSSRPKKPLDSRWSLSP